MSSNFDYEGIPTGFYDEIIRTGSPLRRFWHQAKFDRIIDCLPSGKKSLLDIGCFAGTFLSLVPSERFPQQVGVDIIEKQIRYAQDKWGTPFRTFRHLPPDGSLTQLGQTFDCVTLIEVIEHLDAGQIRRLFEQIAKIMNPGGKLILSTPNYTSLWPIIEIAINKFSSLSYEEQHITKFNFFTARKKLRALVPNLDDHFALDFKTTSHLVAPFLAPLSYGLAKTVADAVPHRLWRFPFGNLVIMRFSFR